jgi:lysyl-tRNA synthetase, class II
MDEPNEQMIQRIKKLETLRSLGVDPYGQRFDVSHSAADLTRESENLSAQELEDGRKAVRLAGRILSLRRFGKASFAHIQDASGRIQVYFKKDVLGEQAFSVFEQLDIGDLIGISGFLFRTKTGELTVQAETLGLLCKSLRPMPEKWHGLSDVEIRYRQRYLDLIVNPEVRTIFYQRNRIIKAIRAFLDEHRFLEVETPMMQPIPGGAAARPFITHHNALGIDLYLRIAPELYLKKLIVGGLDRVYEINRNFRNEGISTVHNPEFTMLEFYMAHTDFNGLMDFTQELLQVVAGQVLDSPKFVYQGTEIDFGGPWKKMGFTEAVLSANRLNSDALDGPDALRKTAKALSVPIKATMSSGKMLQEIFEKTVEPSLIQPTFITDYPTDISPLAKRKADNPRLTERFELFVNGLEIANGFSELNDPQDQRRRFEDQAQCRRRSGSSLDGRGFFARP